MDNQLNSDGSKRLDEIDGIIYLEGLIFIKKQLIVKNDDIVKKTFADLYKYVSKN